MQTISLTTTRRIKIWKFPEDRFIEYEPHDEAGCRFFGIGEEIDVIESTTIPNAVITNIATDGTVTFQALAIPIKELLTVAP